MIYIIIHETNEDLGWTVLTNKDIVFVSTDEDKAKKVLDDYRSLGPTNHYDYEIYVLYEYPEMNAINYPHQEIGIIIDTISYE